MNSEEADHDPHARVFANLTASPDLLQQQKWAGSYIAQQRYVHTDVHICIHQQLEGSAWFVHQQLQLPISAAMCEPAGGPQRSPGRCQPLMKPIRLLVHSIPRVQRSEYAWYSRSMSCRFAFTWLKVEGSLGASVPVRQLGKRIDCYSINTQRIKLPGVSLVKQ
jgi:hypothetical protein